MNVDKSKLNAPLPASSGSTSNPLSQKLSRVLLISFVDSDLAAAITILDDRGFTNDEPSRKGLGAAINMECVQSNKPVLIDYKKIAEVF